MFLLLRKEKKTMDFQIRSFRDQLPNLEKRESSEAEYSEMESSIISVKVYALFGLGVFFYELQIT